MEYSSSQLNNEMMEIKYPMMDEVWHVPWKAILADQTMSITILPQHVLRIEVMESDMDHQDEMMVTWIMEMDVQVVELLRLAIFELEALHHHQTYELQHEVMVQSQEI